MYILVLDKTVSIPKAVWYLYIYSLLIKFDFKKLKHMFHKAFKKKL